MLQRLAATDSDPLSIYFLLLNLGVGTILSLIVRAHFIRFSSILSNREESAQVFPFILLTTVLIITVVKSSLALSLGLVGALSIVRFRTAIKEPEELAYLFISIAIGLGLGANQTVPTIVASLAILFFVALLNYYRRDTENKNLYLSIDWQPGSDHNPEYNLTRLNAVIAKYAQGSDLRRFDVRKESVEASYLLNVDNMEKLSTLVDDLRKSFPSIGVTFLDRDHTPIV